MKFLDNCYQCIKTFSKSLKEYFDCSKCYKKKPAVVQSVSRRRAVPFNPHSQVEPSRRMNSSSFASFSQAAQYTYSENGQRAQEVESALPNPLTLEDGRSNIEIDGLNDRNDESQVQAQTQSQDSQSL